MKAKKTFENAHRLRMKEDAAFYEWMIGRVRSKLQHIESENKENLAGAVALQAVDGNVGVQSKADADWRREHYHDLDEWNKAAGEDKITKQLGEAMIAGEPGKALTEAV